MIRAVINRKTMKRSKSIDKSHIPFVPNRFISALFKAGIMPGNSSLTIYLILISFLFFFDFFYISFLEGIFLPRKRTI